MPDVRSGGFTLVELLLAATMMSVLMVGLSAHLRGGLAVWQRTTTTVDAVQRQEVAMDRLAHDLANGVVYDPRPEAYGSERGRLPSPRFEASSAAWYAIQPGVLPQLPSVRFVTYACELREGEAGLWRTSQSITDARAQVEAAAELLLPGCESMAFRYRVQAPEGASDRLAWVEEWAGAEQTMPRLMDVSIRLTDGRQVTRLLTVPIGTLPLLQVHNQ